MRIRFFNCKHCGKQIDLDTFFTPVQSLTAPMRKNQLCFECAFWMDILKDPPQHSAVVDGSMYIFEPVEHQKAVREMSKGVSLILDLTNNTALAIKITKTIGVIPQQFRQECPDQYRFITYPAFRAVNRYAGVSCEAKGCWDRYHCFWYNKEKSEPDGPWNKIPTRHQPGDEMCESFINKFTMYVNN